MWDGDYDSRHLPKTAKFRWSGSDSTVAGIPSKRWWTRDIDCAALLVEYADEDAIVELTEYAETRRSQLIASVATDADIQIPAPPGLEYRGYQKAGIAYANANVNTLIGDDMGLGKTIQVIGLINMQPAINKILIVVPASLRINWRKELNTWLVRDMRIAILTTKNKREVDADIFIVSYNILSKLPWLVRTVKTPKVVKGKDVIVTTYEGVIEFDLIVADEAQNVKNKGATRSKVFYAAAQPCKRKILLTGTPILNRPVELFPLLDCLGFEMSYWQYVNRYCAATRTHFGHLDVSGASNMEELQIKLRQSIMIRRLKSDVLHELPPKRRQIIELDPDDYTEFIDAESRFIGDDPDDLFDPNFESDEYNNHVSILKEISVEHISEMSILRHRTAMAKVPDVVAYIETALEENEKVIVFAHHRDVIDAIHGSFPVGTAVKYMGGMTDVQKDDTVTGFQENPNIRLFVGQIQAAGVGLTLTAAEVVIFAELDWVPANITQAEDRAHRIGQLQSLLVIHIVISGSIDANLAKRVVSKQNIIDRAMNSDRMLAFIDKQKSDIEDAAGRVHDVVQKADQQEVERMIKEYMEKIKPTS